MKLDKRIRRRTAVYFTIITLLLVFAAISLTVSLPQGLDRKHWRNGPGNVTIGEMTTYYDGCSISTESEQDAIVMARDENGEPIVKGMPVRLFVYGVGEDFQIPDHPSFKTSKAMFIATYCLSLILILCVLFILGSTIAGFRKGLYFNRMQVTLLRFSALVSFLLSITSELSTKFHMIGIGEIYGPTSDIRLAASMTMDLNDIMVPLLILMLAEIINIAMHLNKEEAMTI